MIDRSTTVQANAASIQSRADAVKARAQALEKIVSQLHDAQPGELTRQDIWALYASIQARLEGIMGDAMNMAGEAALIASADAWQQEHGGPGYVAQRRPVEHPELDPATPKQYREIVPERIVRDPFYDRDRYVVRGFPFRNAAGRWAVEVNAIYRDNEGRVSGLVTDTVLCADVTRKGWELTLYPERQGPPDDRDDVAGYTARLLSEPAPTWRGREDNGGR